VNNVANTATPYLDTSFGASSTTPGYPAVEFASPWLIYEAFRDHPEYFVQTSNQQKDTLKNAAVRSPIVQEAVTAGYALADMKFWRNRVRFLGGVRYEYTKSEGYGYKQTLTGYERRANYNSRNYDGYYPSGHLTVNLTDDLLLRVAYAKTIGRPRIVDIVPAVYVGENTTYDGTSGTYPGYITSANTTLVPWEADNWDIDLQYYLPRNGLISAGVFRKDIKNFFGTLATTVDQSIADSLGLSSDYIGWYYSTRINVGDARIDGMELSYEQSLGIFGSWAEPFSVFANYTKLKLEGQNAADFTDFIPETANLGVRAAFKRFSAFAKWNYRGKQLREYNDEWFPGAGEYIRAYPTIDVNVEYQVSKHFSVFATGRNILNEPYEWERSGPGVAAWSTLTSSSSYGAQFTAGIKGTF
jgi:TonB-dependent receptor